MSDDLIEKLVRAYPKTFFLDQASRRPLKLRIHDDLRSDVSHGLTDAELRTALHCYCTSPGYLASMIEGTDRIGLDGLAAGSVTVDAVNAAVKIARLSQKNREQRETKVGKAVAVAATPERQTEKASTPAPSAARITAPNGKPCRRTLQMMLLVAGALQLVDRPRSNVG
jgi:sRNA-binding protein